MQRDKLAIHHVGTLDGFGYLLLPPLTHQQNPLCLCSAGSGKGWLLPPGKSHSDASGVATWLPTGSAAMGTGSHSTAAFSPSRTRAPSPEEETWAGEALTEATDQMTQRCSSEHVLPCPLDADTGIQHRHKLRRSWFSPSFTSRCVFHPPSAGAASVRQKVLRHLALMDEGQPPPPRPQGGEKEMACTRDRAVCLPAKRLPSRLCSFGVK